MPSQDTIRVIIDDVDIPNGVAHARDQTAAIIQVRFNEQPGGTMLVPEAGQTWTVVRRGYTWYLDRRVDLSDLSGLEVGDLKIEASKSLIIEGTSGAINNNPFGATIHDHYYSPTTGWGSVILSRDPVGLITIRPYLNGLEVMPNLWTYDQATRVLTFYTTIGEVGNLVVVYQTWVKLLDDAATVIGKSYITAIEEFIDV